MLIPVSARLSEAIAVSKGESGVATVAAGWSADDGLDVEVSSWPDEPLEATGVIVRAAVTVIVTSGTFGLPMVGNGVDKITGVAVREGVAVGVAVPTWAMVQISPKETTGGGEAWVKEPNPQTQPSMAPSET